MRLLLIALGFLLVSPLRVGAQAPTPSPQEHLTSRGRFMLTGGLSFTFSSDTSARWGTQATPGVTYFLREHVGLGAFASLGYQDHSLGSELSLGGGLQALFDVPLGEHASWFINPWLGYHWLRNERPWAVPTLGGFAFPMPQDRQQYVQLGVFLPFVFKLNAHVGLGIGPFATLSIYRRHDNTLGGSVSRSPDEPGAEETAAAEPVAFGTNPGLFYTGPSTRIDTGLMSTIAVSF